MIRGTISQHDGIFWTKQKQTKHGGCLVDLRSFFRIRNFSKSYKFAETVLKCVKQLFEKQLLLSW